LTHPCLTHPSLAHPCLAHPCLARASAKPGADMRVPGTRSSQKSGDHGITQLPHPRTHGSIPARPGLAATSSHIWSNSIRSTHRSEVCPSSRLCWSRTTAGSTRAGSRAKHSPPARIGSPSSGCPNTHRNGSGIELVWRDLKAHHLAHQTFLDATALDTAIHDAVRNLNRERMPDPLAKLRSSA